MHPLRFVFLGLVAAESLNARAVQDVESPFNNTSSVPDGEDAAQESSEPLALRNPAKLKLVPRPPPTDLSVDAIIIPGPFYTTIMGSDPRTAHHGAAKGFEHTAFRPAIPDRSTTSVTESRASSTTASEETVPTIELEAHSSAPIPHTSAVEALQETIQPVELEVPLSTTASRISSASASQETAWPDELERHSPATALEESAPFSELESYPSATDSLTSSAALSEETVLATELEGYPDAVDITDFVENLLDDTQLFHNITQSNLDGIEICKSYAFDPSPLNYHVSETDEFLREYIATNKGREFYQKHGLMASLAFDYLGIHNYKCGLGLQHLCRIDCPKVVNSIEDLETARRVYFALTSASNFLSISNMVYDGLVAAQSNVGLMSTKMTYDFYWWHQSTDERRREMAYNFFTSMCTWTAQQVFQAVVPVIPWRQMQDFFVYKLTMVTGKSYTNNAAGADDRIDNFGELKWRKWKGETIAKYMNDFTEPNDDPHNLGTYTVPPKHGGHYKFNPSAPTIFDWASVNMNLGRKWERWVYGEKVPMDHTSPDTYLRFSWKRFLPDFRRRVETKGWGDASRQVLVDTKELLQGTARHLQGRWWYFRNKPEGGDPVGPNSLMDVERTLPATPATGPMDNWNPSEQWRQEFGPSTDDFLLDVYTRHIPEIFPEKRFPQSRLQNLPQKLDKARAALKRVMPVFSFFILPMGTKNVFDHVGYHSSEGPGQSHNLANLQYMIQTAGHASRKLISDRINTLFTASQAEELVDLFSMGSFLAADKSTLSTWTPGALEQTLTKSMFYKTLNIAYKSQRIYVSCTPHIISKKRPTTISHKHAVPEDFCENDNTGPQHMKACLQNQVCYLYKWNDRGFPISHHNEEPFGLDNLAADPFNLTPKDLITSSFLSAKTGMTDMQLLGNTSQLAYGPTPDFLIDPTTPGLFSLPVCFSPVSWNGPTTGYAMLKTDPYPNSAMKSLPCYCGSLGSDTRKIWESLRLDATSPAARREYLHHLCPRQIDAKLKSPLERYIARCRLGIKKVGGIIIEGQDALCNIVIEELHKRGVSEIEQVSDAVSDALMCVVHRRKHWRKPHCKKWKDVKIEHVWDLVESAKDAAAAGRKLEARGYRGYEGMAGQAGIAGWEGINGQPGIKGQEGVHGIQGKEGEKGIQGKEGERGYRGRVGIQGYLGQEGRIGMTGVAGRAGQGGRIAEGIADFRFNRNGKETGNTDFSGDTLIGFDAQ